MARSLNRRSKYVFHCHQYRIEALNVKHLLATNEASGISSPWRKERLTEAFFIIRRKLRIGIADGVFQRRRKGVDNPAADLRARFRQLGDIINICLISGS